MLRNRCCLVMFISPSSSRIQRPADQASLARYTARRARCKQVDVWVTRRLRDLKMEKQGPARTLRHHIARAPLFLLESLAIRAEGGRPSTSCWSMITASFAKVPHF